MRACLAVHEPVQPVSIKTGAATKAAAPIRKNKQRVPEKITLRYPFVCGVASGQSAGFMPVCSIWIDFPVPAERAQMRDP